MKNGVIFTIRNLIKQFGATLAVDNASIEIHREEIRGLVGENGSGKTTFISIISGIWKCDHSTMEKNCKHYKPVDPLDAGYIYNT